LAQTLALSLIFFACTVRAEQKPKDKDCLSCHGKPSISKQVNGKQVSEYVDAAKLKRSVHGDLFSCVDCHKSANDPKNKNLRRSAACAECHADEQQAYAHSLHATAKPGAAAAANCQDCHGDAHEILAAADAKSPVNHDNIPATCGRCHGQKFLMESNGVSGQTFISYQQSVHGLAIEKGSK